MDQHARRLERTLAYHCAPALAGVKPADLISWRESEAGDGALLRRYARLLAGRGVRLRVLHRSCGRCLLLIYRPELLRDCLKQPEVADMLGRDGYPKGMESQLRLLGRRLAAPEFPHEIGLFLGYPPEDVEGFRREGGRNCKFTGLWKVYGPVEEAVRRFQVFYHCRAHFCQGMDEGNTLIQMLSAV
ncbi:MAG TPA: DUF3793 family protein [Candidatus Enterenecus stercoripullorum]|nr:DUF3793 family protein [Candidatus Enterenecus stercoripullorum]